MKRTWPWLVLAGLILASSLTAFWVLLPEEPQDIVLDDTGMSEETTNQLLQEIGYLKGTSKDAPR